MLSYDSASQIPTPQALFILDAIDSRDQIIDQALASIEKKYAELAEENKKLKEQLKNNQILRTTNTTYQPIPTIGSDILTESTKKGYMLCRPFKNRDYEYQDNYNNKDVHGEIYNELIKIISSGGKVIPLTRYLSHDDDLQITSDDDLLTEIWHGYFPQAKKKFLASLINSVTEYISENVYVEKVLEQLNIIVGDINKNKQFLKNIFGQDVELGIVFKGGNVYKLFSYITNNYLDANVFQTYLSGMDNFFKKSDCDFSLVVLHTNAGKKEFLHLPRKQNTEHMMCTLKYMILNKFRNNFLKDIHGYHYLGICGKNDIVMTSKMKHVASNIFRGIIDGRLEFESKLFTLMTDKIRFTLLVNISLYKDPQQLKRTYPYVQTSDKSQHTLLGILERDFATVACVNISGEFNVTRGKIVDWYKLFLSICLRDDSLMPTSVEFKNVQFTGGIEDEIRRVETSNMGWRDIRATYHVKEIARIVVGDNVYPVNSDLGKTDDDIFKEITAKQLAHDRTAEICRKRIEKIGRLSSNRNDFSIKIESTNTVAGGFVVLDQTLLASTIPYDNQQSLTSPFNISVNKEIKGGVGKISDRKSLEYWMNNMRRFVYNMDSTERPVYKEMYDRLKKEIDPLVKSNRISEITRTFSLSRLSVSFVIVLKTYSDKYFVLPLAGEFLDLSYAYHGDLGSMIYETYEHYNNFDHQFPTNKLLDEYKQIIKLVNAKPQQPARDLLLMDLSSFDINQITDPDVIKLLDGLVKQTKGDKNLLERFLKHHTYFDQPQHIKMTDIYFPKITSFILDLYLILFVDSTYPWADPKYTKRLQRYIFFVFIERLQTIDMNQIDSLLEDYGIDPNVFNKEMKHMFANFGSTVYRDNTTIENHLINFNRINRSTNNDIMVVGGYVVSICPIDRFMFSNHLLDFLDIDTIGTGYPFVRYQFIHKHRIGQTDYYLLISLTQAEIGIGSNKLIGDIIGAIPRTDENSLTVYLSKIEQNKFKLPNGKDACQVVRVEEVDKNFVQYIRTIETIREKLLLVLFNFKYFNTALSLSKTNVISIDPLKILLNMYEGDMDKILRVI
jgi:hypothetical protein